MKNSSTEISQLSITRVTATEIFPKTEVERAEKCLQSNRSLLIWLDTAKAIVIASI